MKKLVSSILFAAATMTVTAATPLWLRDVQISPDGKTIAFTYKGDIFTVPAAGGEAKRLTTAESYESVPVWSPDGKSIAFASDRNGGQDIYIMEAKGGPARQLTFHSVSEIPQGFTPDGKYVVYSANIQAPAASLIYPSSRMGQLYKVPAEGGRPQQILGTPALSISYLPDGASFLYQDDKGTENEWRKHHTSSVTRDIWRYDAKTGSHTNLTARGGEDRNPVIGGDGETVYFLSERNGGSFNVYSFQLSDPSKVSAVTKFTTHPVRFLSRGANGTLAFTYNGEIYTVNEKGGKPAKVAIDIVTDNVEPVMRRKAGSLAGAAVSPDGKQVAFVSHGDIFVTSVEYPSTRQITKTPQGESYPSWGADNRTLYYTSDRDGHKNIYRATISRKDDPNFSNATLIEETPVFPAKDNIDRQNPLVSPNGELMAFIQDGNKIGVTNLKTRKTRLLTNGETYTARDGGITLDWSPDSEWLAATIDVHQRDPYYDIAIINVSNGEMTNITNDAYINTNPRWVMNGNAIIFSSDRYGMKNHASWGSTEDVLMVFTNREAYDRYRLSDEDFALLKEVEKSQKNNKSSASKDDKKKDKKKDKKDSKKDDAKKDDTKPADAVNVELDGICDRIVRLTPFSSSLGDNYVDNDGENLYFMSRVDNGYDMWKKNLRKGDVSLFKKMGSGGVALQADAAGKNLFLLGSTLRKMSLPGGNMTTISFNATQEIDPVKEREYMYDFIVDQEAKRFLVKDMFGVDWKGYGENYRKFLPHINNNYDFSELASELLGELNVSHTGSGYRANGSQEPTASLGLLYDLTYTGNGLKVSEILKKGPFDRANSRMTPGAVITAIDGESLNGNTDPLTTLNSRVRTKTLISFTLPSGEKIEEVILPTNYSAYNTMLYDRWLERNRHIVDSISGGRLGYVHLESMNDESYRAIYADVLGKYADREGIIIDTRFNGGGRLHEDIEVLFSGKKYLTQEIRGVKSGEMPSKRWLRPSIMITGEANYSNAHGTPWMYKHNKLGKIVGMPVPGTMSSVNWVTLQDPSLYFGIPVVGFRTAEGNFLENTQLEPDIKVANDPAKIVKGIDDQLITAVKTLLNDLKK
ncbi:S41 family peptidase [Duncaniella freteri]|uniref:S41 family peptidase n=2 Tax=Duncaniella TaxID=2518495 RepID=UPI00136ED08B|nr:S41 family peptidase [Duncaniella freteri]NBJ08405.1 peptidase S41 [Alistipes sp. Z76]NCE70412.1 peptidase S41 [Muribaculaceae bacterium M3]